MGRFKAVSIVFERRGVFIGPNAVGALVTMHGTERDEISRAELRGQVGDLFADRLFFCRRRRHEAAVFIENMNHLGVTVTG